MNENEQMNDSMEETSPNESKTQLDHNDASKDMNDASSPENELKIYQDKYVRLNAEFDNYRKRMNKERLELIQTASLDVIRDLLDVVDDCDRTEELLKKDNVELKALKEGVHLVFSKLRKTLEHKGLKSFDSRGEVFDVELHEAITEIPAPNKKGIGKVMDEVQKGYTLNGKLIRHAKVVVGK